MPKIIYVQFLSEQPNSNLHYLNRLVKILNHFISIEPEDKPKGFECHHIIPRSWKPEWSKEPNNLLKVPAKAHYIIHHLLWKAFPKDHSMMYAFWRTYQGQQKQKITAKVYENLRNNLFHSEESKRKMSISKTGKIRKPHSAETKQKMSASLKGKNIGLLLGIKRSDETRQKMSEAKKRETPVILNQKNQIKKEVMH